MRRLLLLCVLLPLTVGAATPESIIEAVRAEGLPSGLVEAKLREARLKQVDAGRVTQALVRLHVSLRDARDLLAPMPGGSHQERARGISAVARALAAGVTRGALTEGLAPVKDLPTAARAAQALQALSSAGLSPAAAARLVHETIERGAADRLLTLRPAVEMLGASGFSPDDAASVLEREDALGRPPLEIAGNRARESSTASGSAPGQAGGSGGASGGAGNDRDRGYGRGDDGRPDKPGKEKKEKP